jgi:hypothetical protein
LFVENCKGIQENSKKFAAKKVETRQRAETTRATNKKFTFRSPSGEIIMEEEEKEPSIVKCIIILILFIIIQNRGLLLCYQKRIH